MTLYFLNILCIIQELILRIERFITNGNFTNTTYNAQAWFLSKCTIEPKNYANGLLFVMFSFNMLVIGVFIHERPYSNHHTTWAPSSSNVTWFSRLNTLGPRQNGRHFADDTFKRIFLNENVRISIKISLKIVPKGPINNIPALVQIMAWHRPGDKPLSEPMMTRLPSLICVTRPQWVNNSIVVLPWSSFYRSQKLFPVTANIDYLQRSPCLLRMFVILYMRGYGTSGKYAQWIYSCSERLSLQWPLVIAGSPVGPANAACRISTADPILLHPADLSSVILQSYLDGWIQ